MRPDGSSITGLSPSQVQELLQPGATAADAKTQTSIASEVGQFQV